ncbi:MAG: hypothetical protein GYB45_07950, partial [Gammaproteobacteria bacterium]|nr:hypothetical protein [Gammaproteobacteria bacterium]
MTVADRTNNPLNVRYNESNNWLGQTGQDSGFSSFSDENYGYRAADRVLGSYGERGINTLRDTISTFAPPSENDTEGYINYVAGQTGIGADDEINLADPGTRATVLAAMAKMESGRDITAGELRQRVDTANSGGQQELSFEEMSRITAAQRQFDDELLTSLVPQAADPREFFPTAPDGFFETFQRGVEIGDTQLRQDMALFESLGKNLLGDTEGANYALQKARVEQATSAALSAGIQQFDEFLAEPTFDGFLNQVTLSIGQITPAAAQTIITAVATGGTAAVAKAGLTTAGKAAVNRLSKDLAAKKLRGEALDEVEEEALSGMYRLVRDNLSFQRGAIAGAFGSEYPMMSAAVYSEFDQAGEELTPERSLQALLGGAPLAAVGVGGETLIAKNILKLAKQKAVREPGEGVFSRLVKDLSKATGVSAVTEATTEVIQEGALTGLRFGIDDEYTAAEAQLRLGQAAFAGFFAGGAFGGAASTPAATLSAIRSQSSQMLQRRVDADVNAAADALDKGITDGAFDGPTQEAVSDLDA